MSQVTCQSWDLDLLIWCSFFIFFFSPAVLYQFSVFSFRLSPDQLFSGKFQVTRLIASPFELCAINREGTFPRPGLVFLTLFFTLIPYTLPNDVSVHDVYVIFGSCYNAFYIVTLLCEPKHNFLQCFNNVFYLLEHIPVLHGDKGMASATAF